MSPALVDLEGRRRRIDWIQNRCDWPLIEAKKDGTFESHREIEHYQGNPPDLTPLGRRLSGLDVSRTPTRDSVALQRAAHTESMLPHLI